MSRYLRNCAEYNSAGINEMLHSLGCGNRKTYIRNNKEFYRPYRNYFDSGLKRNPALELMAAKGYVNHRLVNDGTAKVHCYSVTEAGLAYLEQITGCHFYPVER